MSRPITAVEMVWGTTKTHQRREVPIPRFLVDDLATHIAGKDPENLVFGGIRGGEALRISTFRKAFRPAAAQIGIPDLYPHELRHTAASLAIASGWHNGDSGGDRDRVRADQRPRAYGMIPRASHRW